MNICCNDRPITLQSFSLSLGNEALIGGARLTRFWQLPVLPRVIPRSALEFTFHEKSCTHFVMRGPYEVVYNC